MPQVLIVVALMAASVGGGILTYNYFQNNPGAPGYDDVESAMKTIRTAAAYGAQSATFNGSTVTLTDVNGNAMVPELHLDFSPTFIWAGGNATSVTFTLSQNGNATVNPGTCTGLTIVIKRSSWPINCAPLDITGP